MERRMILFLLILLINLLIVIIYLLWNTIMQKEKNRSIWMKAFVMFICPVVGPSFFFFAYLLYKVFMSQAMDLEDVIFNKEKVETFRHPDEEMERNMVSFHLFIWMKRWNEIWFQLKKLLRLQIRKI